MSLFARETAAEEIAQSVDLAGRLLRTTSVVAAH